MKILFLMAVAMFAASIAFGYMFLSFAESGDFRNKDTAMIGMYATRTGVSACSSWLLFPGFSGGCEVEGRCLMNNTEIKKLLESSGVNIDYVTKNEIVTEGLLWSDFSHLVSFLKKNGVNEEEMCRYNPVSGYVAGPLSRYKLGIETTEAHRELSDKENDLPDYGGHRARQLVQAAETEYRQ